MYDNKKTQCLNLKRVHRKDPMLTIIYDGLCVRVLLSV